MLEKVDKTAVVPIYSFTVSSGLQIGGVWTSNTCEDLEVQTLNEW